MFKVHQCLFLFETFDHLNFDIVSNFVFRISYFRFARLRSQKALTRQRPQKKLFDVIGPTVLPFP